MDDLALLYLWLIAVAGVAFLVGCLVSLDLRALVRRALWRVPQRPPEAPVKDGRAGHVTLYVPIDVWRKLELKVEAPEDFPREAADARFRPGLRKAKETVKPSKEQFHHALCWFAGRLSGEKQWDIFWAWACEHNLPGWVTEAPRARAKSEQELATEAVFCDWGQGHEPR